VTASIILTHPVLLSGRLVADLGNARGNMVREIIEIVRQVANGLPPGQSDPLDDDLPGG
jgi:hypothetical protein